MKTGVPSLAYFLATIASDHAQDLIYTLLNNEREIDSSTVGQLDQAARRIGSHLVHRFPAHSRIVLLLPQGIDFIRAFFGCLYAGMIPVPAPDPSKSVDALLKLSSIIEGSGASAVLVSPALRAMAEQTQLAQVNKLQWLTVAEIQGNIDEAIEAVVHAIRPDDVCFLQYTSGSTRSARGVVVTHANVLANLAYIRDAFRLSPEDVSVTWLPMFHDMGLIGSILGALYQRCKLYIYSPLDFVRNPLLWLRAISRYGATVAGSPNFGYDLCVRRCPEAERATLQLSTWRVAFVGAEPVRASTLRSFAEAFGPYGFSKKAFYPCYGMAEATLLITGGDDATPPALLPVAKESLYTVKVASTNAGAADSVDLVSCGNTHGRLDLILVARKSAPPQAITFEDTIGEIWVRGESVARGYWNDEEETRRVFDCRVTGDPTPFMNTGDLGFVHQGELYVVGRSKDLIIIAGRNYYPQDIEYVAERADPACRASCCAAFGFTPDGDSAEALVIVQEIKTPHAKPEALERIAGAICQRVVGAHGIPIHTLLLVRSGSVPKTSSGKVQRTRCQKAFFDGTLRVIYRRDQVSAGTVQSPCVAPRTELESALKVIWTDVLGVKRISVLDDFFSLGGDSICAAQLASAIDEQYGVPFSVLHLVQAPTIAGCAERIERLLVDQIESLDETEAERLLEIG